VAVEVRQVELAFRHPVQTARGTHNRRPLVLVRVTLDGATGPVEGWGECAALADTTYDAEDVGSAFTLLAETLTPALMDAGTAGRLLSVGECGALRRLAPDAPLAFAALEMAVADAHLRSSGTPLASLLGVEARSVPAGAVVGRYDRVEDLVDEVGRLVDAGYGRVKVKIAPGWDLAPVAAVRRAYPGLVVQVDANESYGPTDGATTGGAGMPPLGARSALTALDPLGLACIEQPFGRADLDAHARLAAEMRTPICLDDSLDSPPAVARAVAMGACSVVCVKPARLGGIGAGLEVIDTCAAAGVPAWIGGMFESGYARGVNAVLAALPGISMVGDLSPARTYLVEDLVAGAPPGASLPAPPGGLRVALPAGPGMGPPPDDAVVERLTRRQVRVPAGAP
jgi:o-succinylbenzoate synthase